MTLGQRIQQLRKDKGMSQEALGEALGVSRQAISKWESDLTIPEIDKLIALSRLFGTSVGALLGVEEDAPEAPDGELTERELTAVEAIVERYLERSKPKHAPRRLLPILAALAAALVLIFWFKGRLDDLNSRVAVLQNNVNSISGSVSSQISSMTDQIQDLLAQEASLFSDAQCTVTSVDIAADTLLVDVRVAPKEYAEGMVMRLTAEPAGEAPLTVEITADDDHIFRLTGWELPLNDEIVLTVTFGTGESWQTQTLDTLWQLKNASLLWLNVERSGQTSMKFAVWSVDWDLRGRFTADEFFAPLYPESACLEVRRNGTAIDYLDLELLQTESRDGFYFQLEDYKHDIRVADGDILEYGVVYRDNYGRQRFYSLECVQFKTDTDGNLDYSFIAAADSTDSVYDALYG